MRAASAPREVHIGKVNPTDLESLRKITDEIRQRIARFGQELA